MRRMENETGDLNAKYRPKRFSDLLGQEGIARALSETVIQDAIPSTLLFAGPPGVGKTSAARVLAAAANCEGRTRLDGNLNPCGTCGQCMAVFSGDAYSALYEIDAASHNGVDSVRELTEHLRYYKRVEHYFVLLDESHRMTREAWDASLKLLEEPGAGQYFILATTDSAKLPPTVRSRAMEFTFSRISQGAIVARLQHIRKREGWAFPDPLLEWVAGAANGSMRDAVLLLHKSAMSGVSDVGNLEGVEGPSDAAHGLVEAAFSGDAVAGSLLIREEDRRGRVHSLPNKVMLDLDERLVRSAEEGASVAERKMLRRLLARTSAAVERAGKPDRAIVLALFLSLIEAASADANGTSQPSGLDDDGGNDDWWSTRTCPNRDREALIRRDGVAISKPCGKLECVVCFFDAAERELHVVASMSPNLLVRLQANSVEQQTVRKRMNRLLSQTKTCAAWHAQRLDSDHSEVFIAARVDAIDDTVSTIRGAVSKCGLTYVDDQVVVDEGILRSWFMVRPLDAGDGNFSDAEKARDEHLGMNGSQVLHFTDGFLIDGEGKGISKRETRKHARRSAA